MILFLYNMSGIEHAYSGSMLIKERDNLMPAGVPFQSEGTTIEFVYKYVYAFKQSFQIVQIRKDSPAYKAGILKNDIILQLNGKPAYDYKLEEIIQIFSTKPGKRIKLLIDRGGKILTYSFKLENVL